MSTRSCIALCLASALLLSGCLPSWQITQTFTLNPDGSGKLVFDVTSNGNTGSEFSNLGSGVEPEQEGPKDPKEIARRTVEKILDRAAGLDALAELSHEILKDGRIRMKGVAYFPNYSELSLPWMKTGEFFTVGPKGLKVGPDPLRTPTSQPASPAKKLTDEEKAKKAILARMEYQKIRQILMAVLDGMKADVTYHLPGKVESPGFLKLTKGGALRCVIDGRKALELLDTTMMNDDLAVAIWTSVDSKSLERSGKILELMHGPGPYTPLRIVLNDKPLFDYKGETTKAKRAMPEMLKKLKLDLAASVFRPKVAKPENIFSEEGGAEDISDDDDDAEDAPKK